MTKVLVNVTTLDFCRKEIELVHALCDRAQVAREVDGELLSMSQRVTVLEHVCAGLVQRLGMEPLSTSH